MSEPHFAAVARPGSPNRIRDELRYGQEWAT